ARRDSATAGVPNRRRFHRERAGCRPWAAPEHGHPSGSCPPRTTPASSSTASETGAPTFSREAVDEEPRAAACLSTGPPLPANYPLPPWWWSPHQVNLFCRPAFLSLAWSSLLCPFGLNTPYAACMSKI